MGEASSSFFNRRQFSKTLAFFSLAMATERALANNHLSSTDSSTETGPAADNPCNQDIKDRQDPTLLAPNQALAFVTGNQQTQRSTLALWVDPKSFGPNETIKKALITDEGGTVLGARYFPEPSATHPVYAIISDALLPTERVNVMVQTSVLQKDKSYTTHVYRFVLGPEKMTPTKVKDLLLPNMISKDLIPIRDQIITTPTRLSKDSYSGLLCSQYPHEKTLAGCHPLPQLFRGPTDALSLDTTTQTFQITLSVANGDKNKSTYLRHYFLTDPVGRLMAAGQRSYQGGNKITLKNLTLQEQTSLGLTSTAMPLIGQCPYLLLFYELSSSLLMMKILYLS